MSPLPLDPFILRGPLVAELERKGVKVECFSFVHPARSFRGLLVRGPVVTAYVNSCPHWNLHLDDSHDNIWDGERLVCSVHGAEFDPNSDDCVAGPCQGASLTPLIAEVDGESVRVFLSGLLSNFGPSRS